jgi:hypothetical protein
MEETGQSAFPSPFSEQIVLTPFSLMTPFSLNAARQLQETGQSAFPSLFPNKLF